MRETDVNHFEREKIQFVETGEERRQEIGTFHTPKFLSIQEKEIQSCQPDTLLFYMGKTFFIKVPHHLRFAITELLSFLYGGNITKSFLL